MVVFQYVGAQHSTHLLNHKLLKLLHDLCQTEPLESREKSNDVATHLHKKQIHLDLVDQPRVQDLHKNEQWQDQLPTHSISISSSDTFQIERTHPIKMGANKASPASPQKNSHFALD